MHGGRVQVRPQREENAALHEGSVRSHGIWEDVRARITGERIGETGRGKCGSSLKRRGRDAIYEKLATVEIVRKRVGGANGKLSLARRVPRDSDARREQAPLTIHTRKPRKAGI